MKIGYLDIGYLILFINRVFLLRQSLNVTILRLLKPLFIKGVDISKFSIRKYIVQNIYFTGYIGGKPVEFCVKRELYIVKELNAKVLIGLDIMGPEGFTLDIPGRTMTVTQNKDLVCAITVTPKEGQRLHRVIRTSDRTVTPPLPPVTPEQPRTTRKERGLPRKRGQQSAGQQSTGQQSAKTLPMVPPPPKRPRRRPRKVRTPSIIGGDTVPE